MVKVKVLGLVADKLLEASTWYINVIVP